MILIYLLLVIVSITLVIKLLAPELNWRAIRLSDLFHFKFDYTLIIKKLLQKNKEITRIYVQEKQEKSLQADQSSQEKITKLEVLLAEKNREIDRLRSQLGVHLDHSADFEKLKCILEEEIQNLRAQNRALKSQTTGVLGVSDS
jgi:hypothetical protein